MFTPTENTISVIRYLVDEKGLGQKEIERNCDINDSLVNKWYHQKVDKILVDNVGKLLLRYKDIRAEYILRGEGPMMYSQMGDESPESLGKKLAEMEKELAARQQLIDDLKERLDAANNYIDAMQRYLNTKK